MEFFTIDMSLFYLHSNSYLVGKNLKDLYLLAEPNK
uniref:Uncharacterized protein n=1 Tax=Anguilla anguilla TaxID=7936 RepID=A0A0E9R5M1_ANGAN